MSNEQNSSAISRLLRDIDTQNSLLNKFYGSNSYSESLKSEVLEEPKTIYLAEKILSLNKNFKNNSNNDKEKDEVASKYEIIKFIKFIGEYKINSSNIVELHNRFFLISTYDRNLFLYNDSCELIVQIKFPFIINSCFEEKCEEKDKLKIIFCSILYIYIISLDLINLKLEIDKTTILNDSEDINNFNDIQNDFKRNINSEVKNYNYLFMNKLKNGKEIFCTNNGVYESTSVLNKEIFMSEIILLEHYIEGILLNDKLICFKSNKQMTNGKDLLTFFNLKTKKIIKKINDYSFNISQYRLILIPINEKKKMLICACTKYSSDQKNGLLIVNIDFISDENIEIKTYFEETESFYVNCICNLNYENNNDKKEDNTDENKNNKIYLLAGGVDDEYHKGIIKLYKIENDEGETNVEYLQDIILNEDFEGSISFIYQLKNGKIIISTGSGNILFTPPNLDGYKNDLDF